MSCILRIYYQSLLSLSFSICNCSEKSSERPLVYNLENCDVEDNKPSKSESFTTDLQFWSEPTMMMNTPVPQDWDTALQMDNDAGGGSPGISVWKRPQNGAIERPSNIFLVPASGNQGTLVASFTEEIQGDEISFTNSTPGCGLHDDVLSQRTGGSELARSQSGADGDDSSSAYDSCLHLTLQDYKGGAHLTSHKVSTIEDLYDAYDGSQPGKKRQKWNLGDNAYELLEPSQDGGTGSTASADLTVWRLHRFNVRRGGKFAKLKCKNGANCKNGMAPCDLNYNRNISRLYNFQTTRCCHKEVASSPVNFPSFDFFLSSPSLPLFSLALWSNWAVSFFFFFVAR